jgi:hypothetical protein
MRQITEPALAGVHKAHALCGAKELDTCPVNLSMGLYLAPSFVRCDPAFLEGIIECGLQYGELPVCRGPARP